MAKSEQGRPINVINFEIWPDPVEGHSLAAEVAAVIRSHIILSEAEVLAVTLWVFHTYCFESFAHTPRLLVTSPTKGCGKTNLLKLIECLAAKSLRASSVPMAGIFRLIEQQKPTLLFDEADNLLRDANDVIAILNDGFTAGGACVRCVGDNFDPKQFSVFAPVSIAAIGRLRDTLEDRAIKITLRRKMQNERIEKFFPHKASVKEQFTRIRSQIARWVADHARELENYDVIDPDWLNDRACDRWRPLFTIAEVLGAGWDVKAAKAAKVIDLTHGRSDDLGTQLLKDIRQILNATSLAVIPSQDLRERLMALPESRWQDFDNRRGLSVAKLARLLEAFEMKPKQHWVEGRNQRGYLRKDFDETFARYLSDQVARVLEAPENSQKQVLDIKSQPLSCKQIVGSFQQSSDLAASTTEWMGSV